MYVRGAIHRADHHPDRTGGGLSLCPVAMALFLSFSILNIADMTTDGAFVLGSAVSAMMCLSGHPVLALPAGCWRRPPPVCHRLLQTKLSVPSILAGIITNIGLYSVNLMVMGKSNQSLFQTDTIYTPGQGAGFAGSWYKVAVTALIVLALAAVLVLFLGTRLGLSIRATGTTWIWCGPPPSTQTSPSLWACARPTP